MTRAVTMNAFSADSPELLDAEVRAVDRVLRSGWYVLGQEVAAFESAWAARCKARHAIGVANGMDALEISLRCLGIGAGHEVITTPITAVATLLSIIRAGATPVLADVEPGTALLSIESVQRCISRRTRAFMPVHLYGRVADMDAWSRLARDAGVFVVEDCAQAHGAKWAGRAAGTFGLCGAFSFYPTKNLGTAGDGGALVTDSDEHAATARMIRNYGQRNRYEHPVLGLNSRLDEIHAAILRERLAWLDRFNARRREIAARYQAAIDNERLALPGAPADPESHVYHLFVIGTDRREALIQHLRTAGIETLIHYPVPAHHQKPMHDLRRDPHGLAVAERHAQCCLSIPCHPNMSDADVERVIEALNDFGG